eukprot:TRINITY_DN35612_c0_g1_i1.p1 TRINITY_DN35612_c0_g1~~TRINITY_DN35612_c0_g1_i1.p1  ORF type:complete len:1094 (-),score=364.73 TRINITY_DN35612_c0_g1_i1:147-3428(-)
MSYAYGYPPSGYPPSGYPASTPGYGTQPPAGYPPASTGYAAAPPASAPQGSYPPPAGSYPPPSGYPQGGYPPNTASQSQSQPAPSYPGYGYGGVPAAATPPPASYPGYPPAGARPERLVVSGCQHQTVGGIVRGNFALSGENHSKPVYKKDGQVNGLDVMLYYWDERDGPNFCGWWFGPKVGGDQVWAYHPNKDTTPPLNGWKVPYDGPVDNSFVLTPSGPAAGGHSQQAPPRQPPPPQHSSYPPPQGHYPPPQAPPASPYQAPPPHAPPPAPGAPWGPPPAYGHAPPYGYHHPPHAPPHGGYHQDQRRREQEEAAERKRKADEKRREDQKRRDEERRKKQEADRKAKEEEAKRKKDLEEKRRQEQKSTLAIRRVIQKVRLATPENIDELQKELEDILKSELQSTGTQKARMKEESDKGLEQAKKRIEVLVESRRKEQEKKAAEDKKRAEQEARAKELIKELSELVDVAEKSTESLKAKCAPLEGNDDKSVADVEKAAAAVEEAGTDAKASTKACTDFILEKGPEMKDPAPATLIPGAILQSSETKQTLAKLLGRINDCSKAADAAIATARGAKDSAVRRATARQKTKELEAIFGKYDKDKDKFLNQKEAAAYAKTELKVSITEELLERIWKCAVPSGEKGVSMNRLYLLKACVGISKELQRDSKRKAARLAKEKLVADLKEKLLVKIKGAEKIAEDAEKDLLKAEDTVGPLAAKARTMPVAEMLKKASEIEKLIKVSNDSLTKVRTKIIAIPEGLDSQYKEDLEEFLTAEVKTLELRVGRNEQRISRVQNICSRFRDQAARKTAADLDRNCYFAAKVARQHGKASGLDAEALFKAVDSKNDGSIDEQEFLKFYAGIDKELKPDEMEADIAANAEKAEGEAAADDKVAAPKAKAKVAELKADLKPDVLKSLFKSLADDGAGKKISKETFIRLMQVYYKVAKETTMTADLEVSDGSSVRTLKVDEVVVLLEGPTKEDKMKVWRIKAKAISDDAEGWITVCGNQGTAFLKEGGRLFKVLRETILTDDMAPPEDMAKAKEAGARKLKDGEVVEVLEYPKKHEESGCTRMKVKAKLDGATGWLTETNKEGVVYADVL